jgi:hypothetical protein
MTPGQMIEQQLWVEGLLAEMDRQADQRTALRWLLDDWIALNDLRRDRGALIAEVAQQRDWLIGAQAPGNEKLIGVLAETIRTLTLMQRR